MIIRGTIEDGGFLIMASGLRLLTQTPHAQRSLSGERIQKKYGVFLTIQSSAIL